MVKKLKTFNLEEEVYKQFSEHCKGQGISMSKKIENFLKEELEKISSPKRIEAPKQETHPMHKYT
ncbi:MAG: hypothetical protein ABH864_02085 [archaeon]